MSHFTVMVVGDDYEKQLAPYHEFECTGENDEFVVDVDITEENIKDYKKHAEKETEIVGIAEWIAEWTGYAIVYSDKTPALNAQHKYGYTLVDRTTEDVLKVIRRTNPNSHWDWYQMGGRWSGYFKLKEGAVGEVGTPSLLGSNREEYTGRADQAYIRDIDFEAMRSEAGKTATEMWNLVNDAVDTSILKYTWDDLVKKFWGDNASLTRDEAIELYDNQKAVKEFKLLKMESDKLSYSARVEEYTMTEEEYVNNARNSAISSYALIKDSAWYAKGEMGWWGMSHDEKEQGDWDKQLNDMLDSLPDDTLITVVDCHI